MQTHCVLGERILREPSLTETCRVIDIVGSTSPTLMADPLMELAAAIALAHHERWDGADIRTD